MILCYSIFRIGGDLNYEDKKNKEYFCKNIGKNSN